MTAEQLMAELEKCEPSAGLYWRDPVRGEYVSIQTIEDYGGRVFLSWTPPAREKEA